MYYTYIIRCEDNSLYTGITTDLKRRFEEHQEKDKKCAKYTLRHSAIKLECAWESQDRSFASKLEFRIKALNKNEKEALIKDNENFQKILKEKLDISEYKRVLNF